jgi:hypothetical protein
MAPIAGKSFARPKENRDIPNDVQKFRKSCGNNQINEAQNDRCHEAGHLPAASTSSKS